MWECGLKRNLLQPNGAIHAVTPYVGVWIETGRGERSGRNCGVTPYVGVWIETLKRVKGEQGAIVTPYVGVWIETFFITP